MSKMKSLFQSFMPIILVLLLVAISSLPTFAAQPMTKEKPPETEIVVTPTDTWAVEILPDSDPDQLALLMGAENLGQIGSLENVYLFRVPGSEEVSAAAEIFAADSGVVWFEQQVARQRVTRAPTDPLYGSQWHLQDANVPAVWTAGYMGSGVNIAIVDDGLQHTHPDLSPNYQSSLSWDFVDDDNNPAPSTGDGHGTSVAGVAAARDDGVSCGVGIAYRAGLSGLRLITDAGTTDAQEASALQYEFADNHIYNNSWGPLDIGSLDGPGVLTQQALLNGVTNGRGGKGSIYVWAAGNGLATNDNVNYDGYANSRFTIAVGAVGDNGVQAWYSEPGAAMLVTAPSSGSSIGITTTDLLGADGYSDGNCTSVFGGTSASSPVVAGVVALMLEANPNLGWRDVQHILVKTAIKNDPTDAGWTLNGAGYPINHKYGFGMVNAQAAVTRALTWTNVSAPISFSQTQNVNQAIPDNNSTGITSTINVSSNFLLEHVEVVFTATHTYRGDLRVVLTSPSGTESVLAAQRADGTPNYTSWKFMTTRSWNEMTAGNWTLRVADEAFIDTGVFNSWQLILHGREGSDIDVFVAGSLQKHYDIPQHESVRDVYTGLNNGPVLIDSASDVLSSIQVLYKGVSYSEMLGFPAVQVTNEYWFPVYDSTTLNSQLRVGNLSSTSTNITVYLGNGQQIDSFTLGGNQAIRKNYSGENSGPLRIVSSATNILASVRLLYGDSYTEELGYPGNQLTTDYWFPWYNNVAFPSELRVANTGGVAANVTVYIGDNDVLDTFSIPVGEAVRVSYAGENNGPLRVVTSSSTILPSIRVIYKGISYSEMLGLPNNKLTDEYWLPVYDSAGANSQLRIGNVGGQATTVTVYLGNGEILDVIELGVGGAIRKNYSGKNGGPLRVVSSNSSVLVTNRILYVTAGYETYYELLAYPDSSLSGDLWFPWYNNVAFLSELRIAVP